MALLALGLVIESLRFALLSGVRYVLSLHLSNINLNGKIRTGQCVSIIAHLWLSNIPIKSWPAYVTIDNILPDQKVSDFINPDPT